MFKIRKIITFVLMFLLLLNLVSAGIFDKEDFYIKKFTGNITQQFYSINQTINITNNITSYVYNNTINNISNNYYYNTTWGTIIGNISLQTDLVNYVSNLVNVGAFNQTIFSASLLSGVDGSIGRSVIVGNNPYFVSVDNFAYYLGYEYNLSGGVLTFNIPMYNEQLINLFGSSSTISFYVYNGSSCNGLDGSVYRNLSIIGEPLQLAVDNFIYYKNYDYSYNNFTITFNTPLYNEQVIGVWI